MWFVASAYRVVDKHHRSLKTSFKNCVPGLKTKLGRNSFLVNDIFNGYDFAISEMYNAFHVKAKRLQ